MKPIPLDEFISAFAEILDEEAAAAAAPKPDPTEYLTGYLAGIHALSGHLLDVLGD